ncbi:type VI secretion system-associated protein TagF [Pseudomonas sp. GD03842]|uniref:type VI secretion system-associated protein TagF n=1 Tax=Pseudomonas sp. GD03842 TaxID=2975385 RepID=UPI002447BD3C|nr:type VI secretion system-associated protein TagF [Pseudomonas sp. GD03842]MDH0747860.1 type VI secretion system-associated protein TagF [Pseudomonas sp. GD03842]
MIGCFGKIPASADFVSLHGAADEVCEFDGWLQNALAAIHPREDWRTLFDRLPVCFVSYRARSGNWLLGGLVSSMDASQRRYPFFIFQTLKAEENERLVNPFTLSELFCGQIKPLLHLGVQGEQPARLFEKIKALRPLQGQDLALFRQVHDKFLRNFNLGDIADALKGAYPEFITSAVLTRLHAARHSLHHADAPAISLPLPAERGLKNPTADLWVDWLTRMSAGRASPQVSVLADDFLRPKLFCFPNRGNHSLYTVLTGQGQATDTYDVLANFETFDEHHRQPAMPDTERPLYDAIDRFVDAPDMKSV